MINVNVKSNSVRTTIIADVTSTPRSVFQQAGIDTSTSQVNVDGIVITGAALDKSFADLHIADGSTVGLNAIVKADGAGI